MLSGFALRCCTLRCCTRRRFRRYCVHCRHVLRGFPSGHDLSTRVDIFTWRHVILRQSGLGRAIPPRCACRCSGIPSRRPAFTATKSEPGQQRHQGRTNRRSEAKVRWRQVEIAGAHMRVRVAAIGRHTGSGRRPSNCTRLTTRRRHSARLHRLGGLAADTVLLQFHQHPAFQRE